MQNIIRLFYIHGKFGKHGKNQDHIINLIIWTWETFFYNIHLLIHFN